MRSRCFFAIYSGICLMMLQQIKAETCETEDESFEQGKSDEKLKKKTAYTTCIKSPACDGCENIIKNSLPMLIRENIIKEGEIGVNDGSAYKKKGWHHTLTLLEGDDIITKRTKNELVTINGTVNGKVGKRLYGKSNFGSRFDSKAIMKYRPTGLYAAPGDIVTITLPEKLKGKIGVYIGHFEYKIWFPYMDKSSQKPHVFKIGSPWGGLILLYLKTRRIKGEFTITVDNAIKAPTYILGKTTNEEWNNEIKHYSPKWAVLRVPGQATIYVQTLKIKDITDMEGSMTKIKKGMDVLEKMIALPEGSQPGEEVILFYPGWGGGVHFPINCEAGTALCGDSVYPLKEGKTDTYYDDFFKTLGTNGLVGHELGHGYCYRKLPNMGNQWTSELVASYQRWRMGDPDEHSPKKSWFMNSTDFDFFLLDRMVSFSLYSDGKPCGEARFANNKQLIEDAWDKCWKWLNWIPQRLHGWQVWEKVNALYVKNKTKYPRRGQMKDHLESWMQMQDLNTHDRMVDLYCQATGYNMLPLFDWYNINERSGLNPTVRENCMKLPESKLLTEWLNVAECVKESMNGLKEITECEDMPRFPPHEGLCLLNGVCSEDQANGGTTQMKNRFDLKGTYTNVWSFTRVDYDLPAHSEETCLKRAKTFFEDCQNEYSQIVTATWVTKDGSSKEKKFPYHPKAIGPFISARASSTHGNFIPLNSIDGVKYEKSRNFFHSNEENYPWLEIKLNTPKTIFEVTIFNRKDCCGDRLKNAEIRAGMSRVPDGTSNQLLATNNVCGTYQGPAANGEKIKIVCNQPIMAEYITIQLKDQGTLQVTEVEITCE